MKQPVKMLLELEAHYARMLAGVRSLIAAERGQGDPPKGSVGGTPLNGEQPFSALTKAQAVTQILKERGSMRVAELFAEMKKRKHPVASSGALSNLLSTDAQFKKQGSGIWTLSTPEETRGALK
jgi:hypothetical protein